MRGMAYIATERAYIMTAPNINTEYKTADGRRIISAGNAGVNVTLETGEQAAKAKKAELEAAIEEIKLQGLMGGIKIRTAHNPGPITR